MRFAFDTASTGPVWVLVLGSSLVICLVLAFILARRIVRARYFRRRDRCALSVRKDWERIVSGEIPAANWVFQPLRRQTVEDIALDRRDAASPGEARALDAFFRTSGLLDRHQHAAAQGTGWRKRKAIQALGRMRAPESLSLIVQALEDPCQDTALDAVRALGSIGTPAAGAAIVLRLGRAPELPLGIVEPALLNCYRGDAAGLLRATLEAADHSRPILARVLAEVAVPETSGDLAILATDPNADVRASVARILAVARPPGAAGLLSELARDPVWFVRLRSMLALGALQDPYLLPVLVEGLCDRNRLVRLRAASALAAMDGQQHLILRLVEGTGDHYALQSLVGALDRAGKLRPLVDALGEAGAHRESTLLAILRGGATRILAEAARAHPQERVRLRLRDMLARCEDPAVAAYLAQIETVLPVSPEAAPREYVEQLRGLANALEGAAEDGPRQEVPPAS